MHARFIESDPMHLISFRHFLLFSAAIVPAPVLAQESVSSQPESAEPALALSEIITVTARRREESAQEVPTRARFTIEC